MKNLIVSREGAVAVVKVNRPEKLNALNIETLGELLETFTRLKTDAEVRCVVLTGEGARAFVAGADISEFLQMSPIAAREFSTRGNQLLLLIENLGKPVVAAINGFALGGGCELALACTLRVAADTAQLGQPEIALGIMPGFGGTQRLVRICGKGRAMELCLLGDRIDARRAFELGIVNFVYPAAEFWPKTMALAQRIAGLAPVAAKYILEAINRGAEAGLSEAIDYESHLFALCFATADMKEGVSAFLQKRKAEFKGV